MRKLTAVALSTLVLTFGVAALAFAHDHDAGKAASAGPWKGEIVDVACYVPNAAKGAGHADCAKKCAKAGQPIALLTGDGDLLLLMADHDNGKPFEAAKDLAGGMAEISGTMAERDGLKVVTVSGAKAAS